MTAKDNFMIVLKQQILLLSVKVGSLLYSTKALLLICCCFMTALKETSCSIELF